MRIGVITPSEIAGRRFLPALEIVESVDFAGVGISSYEEWLKYDEINYDEFETIRKANQTKANAMTASYGGIVYNSFAELICADDVDALYIPLPPALHYEWARRALEAGKHVLVEKPSTICGRDTGELVRIAESNGLALHENYMFVFHNQIAKIDELIRNNEIGELRLIRLAFGFPMRAAGDFRYSKAMGGGALFDAGGYAIKYADRLLGETAAVTQASLNHIEGFDVDLYGSATLENADGLTAQISFGMDNDYKCEAEIWGSDGTISTGRVFTAPSGYSPVLRIKHNQDIIEMELDEDDAFKKSIEHFLFCIRDMQARHETYKMIERQSQLVDQVLEIANTR